MQQGYAPQQYPPLSPCYPPQQAWYPPQQYMQQQPVMIQQGGYASQQYQSPGKVKMALILAIIVAVVSTITAIFWAATVNIWGGVVTLFFYLLAHGFGLAGAGCKNTCLMITYAVFATIYAVISFGEGCYFAYWAHQASKAMSCLDNHMCFDYYRRAHETEYHKMKELCAAKHAPSLEDCLMSDRNHLIVLSALLFIVTPLFATSAGFFFRARSEVNAQEFQSALGGQPPVVPNSGSQTQRTA